MCRVRRCGSRHAPGSHACSVVARPSQEPSTTTANTTEKAKTRLGAGASGAWRCSHMTMPAWPYSTTQVVNPTSEISDQSIDQVCAQSCGPEWALSGTAAPETATTPRVWPGPTTPETHCGGHVALLGESDPDPFGSNRHAVELENGGVHREGHAAWEERAQTHGQHLPLRERRLVAGSGASLEADERGGRIRLGQETLAPTRPARSVAQLCCKISSK